MIVVILDHLAEWPSGGFIGVDVFFVISGFLITGHLLREYDKNGHISFVSFYKKRAKRILPAAVLVLVVTLAASFVVFNQARFKDTLWDGFWAFLFGANWRFAAVGTDYFTADGPISPLQHFWSLAVEEQFYFVWPWLLLLAFFVFLRGRWAGSRKAAHAVAGFAIAAVSVVSLAWALFESASNPGLAYFSTLSRGWELGFGAGLAVAMPALARMPLAIRPVLAWIGLAGLGISLFTISETTVFPAPGALLPVLSAAAVIAASAGVEPHRSLSVLTNPVSRYLGDISYSLYLWHFPVVIIAATVYGEGTIPYYGIVFAVIVVLSVFAYHLWEDPIRRSDWLTGKREWTKNIQFSDVYKHTALGFLACTTAVVVAAASIPPEPVGVAAPPAKAATDLATTGTPEEKAFMDLSAQISASASLAEFPQTQPSVEDPGAWKPEQMEKGSECLNPADITDTTTCTYGDGNKLALVVGDSVGMSWIPAITAALEPHGYRVHGVGLSDCPFAAVDVAIENNPTSSEACNRSKPDIENQIKNLGPDLVISSDFEYNIVRLASKARGENGVNEWRDGLIRSVNMAKSYGAKVAILSPNPAGASPLKCITGVSKPADCIEPIAGSWSQKAQAEKAAAAAAGATYIDARKWFCTSDGTCPLIVDNMLTRWDVAHMSGQYGKRIGPLMAPELLS